MTEKQRSNEKRKEIPILTVTPGRYCDLLIGATKYVTTHGSEELTPGEYRLEAKGFEPTIVFVTQLKQTHYDSIEQIVEDPNIRTSDLIDGATSQEVIDFYELKSEAFQMRMRIEGLNLYAVEGRAELKQKLTICERMLGIGNQQIKDLVDWGAEIGGMPLPDIMDVRRRLERLEKRRGNLAAQLGIKNVEESVDGWTRIPSRDTRRKIFPGKG